MNKYQIEIELSKFKLSWMFLGCMIFVLIGILFVMNPTKYESFIMGSPTFIFISGLLALLFFGLLGLFFLKKILDKSFGLVISDQGITDNSSGVSAGFIPWKDIIAIQETEVMNQKFINVIVKDPEAYINAQKNFLKRRAMQANYKLYGIAIGISAKGLKISYEELRELLEKKFKDYSFLNKGQTR
jgi:hypothetical protein